MSPSPTSVVCQKFLNNNLVVLPIQSSLAWKGGYREVLGDAPHFISHASAMEIHRMVTQPQFLVFASSTKRVPNRTLNGTEYRFVLIKPNLFFGTTKHWVTKQEFVDISDLERTVIDGLRQPEYCGGVTEVAKGRSDPAKGGSARGALAPSGQYLSQRTRRSPRELT
jgi:predicted transcriptional regulator of viral defense system